MSVFDDPRGKLRWLEEELLDEDTENEEFEEETEEEEFFQPRLRRRQQTSKAIYADERQIDDSDAVLVKKRKVKGLRRLKFLAFLEMLGILAVVWWWIKWLY